MDIITSQCGIADGLLDCFKDLCKDLGYLHFENTSYFKDLILDEKSGLEITVEALREKDEDDEFRYYAHITRLKGGLLAYKCFVHTAIRRIY